MPVLEPELSGCGITGLESPNGIPWSWLLPEIKRGLSLGLEEGQKFCERWTNSMVEAAMREDPARQTLK
jgi:hypothetical protein